MHPRGVTFELLSWISCCISVTALNTPLLWHSIQRDKAYRAVTRILHKRLYPRDGLLTRYSANQMKAAQTRLYIALCAASIALAGIR